MCWYHLGRKPNIPRRNFKVLSVSLISKAVVQISLIPKPKNVEYDTKSLHLFEYNCPDLVQRSECSCRNECWLKNFKFCELCSRLHILLARVLKTYLAKFAAIWLEKGQKAGFFCVLYAQKSHKQRQRKGKIERSRRNEGGEEKNSNYCTLIFFEKRRKRSMQRSRFQKSSWTYIYYSKFLTDVCKSINCKFLNLRNSFKKQVSRKMLDRSCYDSSRPFPSCL